MSRTVFALAASGLMLAAASFTPAAADAKVCRAPIEATGHGQAVEPSLPDYGTHYARRQARHNWKLAVIAADGVRFSFLSHARHVGYSEDRGAGQIYITLKATPCT